MIEILLKFLPGIIAAIIASYLAARWSLNKIYSEKWWERKEKAYSEIIEALYHNMQYCEVQSHFYQDHTVTEETMKKCQNQYSEAYSKLKKATDIGGFVISTEAAKVLKDLRNRPILDWRKNPPWEIFEQEVLYHKQALEKLVEIANKDLKVTKA